MRGFFKSALVGLLAGLLSTLPAQATTIYATSGGGNSGGVIKTTVGALPTCNSSTQGRVYAVTDATANTCTAGGASHELCICDGASWVIVGDGTAAPGAVAWTDVGAGTNTNAQLVGTGGTFNASGTGVVGATLLNTVSAGEPDIRVNTTANGWWLDYNGDGSQADDWSEGFIDGTAYGTTGDTRRMTCNPAVYEIAGSDTAGIQECITALQAIGGGIVQLGPRTYNISGAVPITLEGDGADEIVIQGSGPGQSLISCSTAGGCTAAAVIDILQPRMVIRDAWINADRGATAVDGIRIGEPDSADCTASKVPAECCTGAGTGTCTPDYVRDTQIYNILLTGSNQAAGSRNGFGIRHWGLVTNIHDNVIKWFSTGVYFSGNATGTSNAVKLTDNDITSNDYGIRTTSGLGVFAAGADFGTILFSGNTIESNFNEGVSITGNSTNGSAKPALVFISNHIEANESGIRVTGNAGGDATDPDITTIGNAFTQVQDATCTAANAPVDCCTGVGTGTCDTSEDSIIADTNTDAKIISIGDQFNGLTSCITHPGTGFVNLQSKQVSDVTCTPDVSGGTAVVVDYDKMLLHQKDATNCTDNTGNYGELCEELDDNVLYVCETSTGCAGAGWTSFGGAGGSGDITAVGPMYAGPGAAFTDAVITSGTEFLTIEGTGDDASEYHFALPGANPASDIIWTMPTLTGTLVGSGDTGTVTSTILLNDTITESDLAADLAFADGDSLNLTAITLSATGEGLIVTSPADCNALTGLTTGTVCYDTTDDAICVYDGAAMDCQTLGAAGSGDVTDVGDCAGPACFTTAGVGTNLFTNSDFIIDLDNNNDGSNSFIIQESATEAVAFQVTEAGVVTLPSTGSISIPANATDGQSIILWEDSDIDGDADETWTLDVGQTDITTSVAVGVRADGGLSFINGGMAGTLIAAGYYSDAADPADGGDTRLGNAETICWEASPAGTDVCITATSAELIDITGGTLNAADLSGIVPGAVDGTTPAADDNDTSLATTAYVQTEINAMGGAGLTCSAGSCATTSSEASFVASGTIAPASDGALVIDTDGDGVNVLHDVLGFQSGAEDFFVFAVREYPTVNGQILKFNSTNDDVEWATDADSGGAPALNAVTAATGTTTINNAENAIVWGWDTAATTLATTTAFSFNYTNDAAVDTFDQTVVAIGRPASAGTAASLSLLRLENLDTDGLVTNGILFDVAAGAITTAIDASDPQIGTALSIGANDILMTTGNIITGAQTIESTELDRLNGKDAALVDTNDTTAGLTVLNGTSLTVGGGGASVVHTVDTTGTDVTMTFSSNSLVIAATTVDHTDGSIPTADLATEVRSMYWGAGALSTDGTDCQAPAEVTLASGPKVYTAACAMASSETDGFIYGSTVLPDAINIAADVSFEVTARVLTDNAGSTAHGYIEIQCVTADATITSTWNSGTDLDVTQAAGDVADDVLQDTATGVDLAQGASADCVGGDIMFWRYKVCDTDATPSTGCTSSAGAENDHHYLGFKMEYTTDIGDVL